MRNPRSLSLLTIGSLVFAIIFLSIQPARASTSGLEFKYNGTARFEHLGVEEGLPHETVLSVIQDQDGFMWFATADGLSRYDGASFTVFRHDKENSNSLSNNNTFALIQSQDGLLWIGTDPGGLNVFDPKTQKFTFFMHSADDANSLADDSVWSLLEARDGSIWAGTRGGLSRLDRASGKFTNYLPDPNDPRSLANPVVYRIYEDKTGQIWVGTRGGLQRFEPATGDFSIYVNDPNNPLSLSNNNVWAMTEDSQGNFWIGTRRGGLNLFDPATGTFKAFKHDPADPESLSDDNIWSIFEDSQANLWVVTENGGLNLFNRATQKFKSFQHDSRDPLSLSNNDVFWMTEDRSGALWISSRYGGVNILAPYQQRFGLYRSIPGNPNSLSSNNVYSVFADQDGTLWVGTFGGGLNRIDAKSGQVEIFKRDPNDPTSLSDDKIYNVYRDEQGVLWVATSGGGLNRMDPVSGKFTAYKYTAETPDVIGSNYLTTLDPAGNGQLWVGTLGYGLNLFDPASGKMIKEYFHDDKNPNSLSEDTVYDVGVEKSGRLWIATARGGLELLDPKTDTITHHRYNPNDANSIPGDTVQAVYLDEANGWIWAGTSEGLGRLELSTQTWKRFSTKDGLANDTIMGIQPDESGNLWVSTSKGLSRLRLADNTFTNFDSRDGLQGDQFTLAGSQRGPDGSLYFGGANGLTFFHGADISANPFTPPVVFTGFDLFNQPVAVGSEILPAPIEKMDKLVLTYDDFVFRLKFAALSYQIPTKNLYQYKMEGFDKDWYPPSSNRDATYTNLAPGTYTFMVRAANNDGVWSDTPAKLVIEVLPPWWATWWFRAFLALLAILAIWGVFTIRTHSILAINLELEKRVAERTQELKEAEIKLRDQAIHDALTRLYNRHILSDRLEAELTRAKRQNYPVAFLLIDLDHFKKINDLYGHQAGDLALVSVSQVITENIRKSDIACRYGGEEFMLILPEMYEADALQRAEQFRSAIEMLAVPVPNRDQIIHITASIGVAVFPSQGINSDQMFTAVDQALYSAKEKGRNQAVLYTPVSKTE